MKRVIAKISFLSSESGGRSQPIPVMHFGCPVFLRMFLPFQNMDMTAVSLFLDMRNRYRRCRATVPTHAGPVGVKRVLHCG